MMAHYLAWARQQDLSSCVSNRWLEVNYQPIADRRTGRLIGAKAQSRWARGGVSVPPQVVRQLTDAVIHQVAEDYSVYLWACKDFSIRLPLSPQDILDPDLPEYVAAILERYGIPASAIILDASDMPLGDQPTALPIAALARQYFAIANEAQTLGR
ncbi:EAL domain-containing protein [Pseudomonas sp. RA_35y_Pfl2_P32]|uniref:EAL domain-containing protein n=1 Tax=Pseudomonas sp. RA_35y_Pfl2_P32 TaxID=3088705 RepID=UPI0030D8BAA5